MRQYKETVADTLPDDMKLKVVGLLRQHNGILHCSENSCFLQTCTGKGANMKGSKGSKLAQLAGATSLAEEA